MEQYKCILSLPVARYLLAQGFRIVDIDKSKKARGRLVFIFKNSYALQAALDNYLKGDDATANATAKRKQPSGDHTENQ